MNREKRQGATLASAIGSEWAKLWSVSTSTACLLAGLALTGVFAFYYASIARINAHPLQPLGNAPVSALTLGQFTLLVLAMATVTGEYATGSARASLLWVPVRARLHLAKSAVTAAVAFAAGTGFGAVGLAVAWGPFGGRATFDAAQSATQVLAMGVYCALLAVLAVGVALALRTAAAALSVLVVLVAGLPVMCTGLGGPLLTAVNDLLPQTAGTYFMRGGDTPYPAPVGLLIVLGWAVAAHLAGLVVLRRRDA
ncbi:ABC transporter [Streptomyces spiroverticillatus]|uniref:ABC transporter n=1 Tax=Streptomyces finlayi TaxID=67296 RepID=A0A918X1P0_9ACTN|nr:ABC transporter permease [Streptomyces finlayi]GHA21704.1 ABC transporter [Streptomyces spiroverticillatus]GHD03966.1 ABC transporter [Streptomyces finlayi]